MLKGMQEFLNIIACYIWRFGSNGFISLSVLVIQFLNGQNLIELMRKRPSANSGYKGAV